MRRKNNLISSDNYKIGTPDWKYARMLEERRGHSYQYYNDELGDKLEKLGYKFYIFTEDTRFSGGDVTSSEWEAKETVEKLRNDGNIARIIVGVEKNIQRIKMYSVIYKPRKGKSNR